MIELLGLAGLGAAILSPLVLRHWLSEPARLLGTAEIGVLYPRRCRAGTASRRPLSRHGMRGYAATAVPARAEPAGSGRPGAIIFSFTASARERRPG